MAGMNVVIGSGPAGVACAQALLDQGESVRMLDAGLVLEPERAALVEQLKRGRPDEWTSSDLKAYQAGMIPDVGGVPLKLVYGSDFAYRGADESLGTQYRGVGLRPSLAKGGLSNVWGAAMLPYLERDLERWPFGLAVLAPHYSAVLRLTGLAARADSLEALFPLFTQELTNLRLSQQATRLLDNLGRNRRSLEQAGVYFGQSRLAVRGQSPRGGDGCNYCRLCMYGCPYGHIYTSAATVSQLQLNRNFSYQPGVLVTALRELGSGVQITGIEQSTGKPGTWHGARVFVGAGAIPTTRILLRSLEAYGQTAWLYDSQYFLLPLIMLKRVAGASREWAHTLSQVFIELLAPSGKGPTAHLQFYSNSDLISQAVANSFGPLQRPLAWLVRDLQERLLVAQGFLPSDRSSRIAVRLEKDRSDGPDTLELKAEINPEARARVRQAVAKLLRHAWHLGAVPVPPMLKVAEPGRSFHSGGSFPMSHQPKGFQTDLLGRLPGWQRVHAIDATIFPSIPATTITLSVMANAHRIGWEAAQLDRLGSAGA